MAKAKPVKPTVRRFVYSASVSIDVEKPNEAQGLAFAKVTLESLKNVAGVKNLTVVCCEMSSTGCARCGTVKATSQLVSLLGDRYCMTCLGDLVQAEA